MDRKIVPILKKSIDTRPYILRNPGLMNIRKGKHGKFDKVQNESKDWLRDTLPTWSRLFRHNAIGQYRQLTMTKRNSYDVEIEGLLLSLWGNIHPTSTIFEEKVRGKQDLACCIIMLCTTKIYDLSEWTPQLLDAIVINGNRYFEQSIEDQEASHSAISIDNLNAHCWLDSVQFRVNIETVLNGKLYIRSNCRNINLAESLMHFFSNFDLGILECCKRHLAFGFVDGPNGGYFLYDCQSRGIPLFSKDHGVSYVLLMQNLQMLLYCMVVTLNVHKMHESFVIHSVRINTDFFKINGKNTTDV